MIKAGREDVADLRFLKNDEQKINLTWEDYDNTRSFFGADIKIDKNEFEKLNNDERMKLIKGIERDYKLSASSTVDELLNGYRKTEYPDFEPLIDIKD